MKPKISEYNQNHPMTGYKRNELVTIAAVGDTEMTDIERIKTASAIALHHFSFIMDSKFNTIQILDPNGRIRFSYKACKVESGLRNWMGEGKMLPTLTYLIDLFLTFKKDLLLDVMEQYRKRLSNDELLYLQVFHPTTQSVETGIYIWNTTQER